MGPVMLHRLPRIVYNHCQKMPADMITSLQSPSNLMSIDADAQLLLDMFVTVSGSKRSWTCYYGVSR